MKEIRTLIGRLLASSLIFGALSALVPGQQHPSDISQGPPDVCQRIVVMGAVRTPSRFEFRENLRLRELVACAGGVADNAGKYLQIIHAGQWESCRKSGEVSKQAKSIGTPESYNLAVHSLTAIANGGGKSNPVVQVGDIIMVLESDPVYIVGGVVAPQAIYLKEKLTLTQAIAIAGGVRRGGKTDRIRIIRQTPESPARTEIIVDLQAVRKHRAEDPVLQVFDIIEVPEKPWGHGTCCRRIDGPWSALPLRAVCEDSQVLSAK